MTDQTSCSNSPTRPPGSGRDRGGSERPGRAVGAAVVASGLAFSVSLYPMPDGPKLSDLFAPKGGSSSESSKVVDARLLNLRFVDASKLNLPDLAKLAALTNGLPDSATRGLMDLVTKYGLPDVVKALEVIQSFAPLTHSFPAIIGLGGGGGSSWGSPVLMWLLDYLRLNPPVLSNLGLVEVVATILPKLAQSLGIPQAQTAPSIETRAVALDVAPPTPTGAPLSAPPDPPVSATVEAPVSAPTEVSVAPTVEVSVAPTTEVSVAPTTEVSVAPTTEVPVSAPTETPAPTYTEAPASAPPEPGGTPLASPNSAAPEPNPPNSDPPSSPSAGSGGGSSSDSGGGSSAGSGGGSSAGSGGGSAGSSGGGSSGDSGGGSSGGSGGGSAGGE
jgi:hypothetical protein